MKNQKKEEIEKTKENKMEKLRSELQSLFEGIEIDANIKNIIVNKFLNKIANEVSLGNLKERLEVLYEFEKNYLELIKDYKEEMKFAANLQEDLRKERTKFFSEDIKEVSNTLKESQVDGKVASLWIKELVGSYTKSLDLSSGLIEEQTLDMIGEIRQQAKSEAQAVKKK